MIWDFLTYQRAAAAERTADDARSQARTLGTDVHHVRDDLQRMMLVVHAMWDLLREKAGLTDEDLLQKINELDLRDGVQDGKHAQPARPCAACGRPMSNRFARCLYCGAHDEARLPFGGNG